MQGIKSNPNSSFATSVLNQHRLTLALKASAITIAVIALYFQDLSIIFSGALTTESTFHILAIPFIFAYLVYRKRKMITASLIPSEESKQAFKKHFSLLAGVSLCAVAILTYWYGSYSFMPLEFHMATLPFLTAGLVLVLFNPQTLKQLIFPIIFLIFLTPPPSEILFGVGSALANLGAVASNALTNLFGIPATLSSSNVGPIITIIRPDSTSIPFNVGVACSGIYSLIGFTIFAILIAYITAGKLRNKLLILAIGIPFMILLNIIRITIILAIGYSYGEDMALELFHSMGATVLMFIGTFILLGISEKVIKKPAPPPLCPTCNPAPKTITTQFCSTCGKIFKTPTIKLNRSDITKIIGIALVTIVLLSIQAPTFALTEGPAEVLSQTAQGTQISNRNSILPEIDGYRLRYSYRDTQYEKTSGNDAAMVYIYSPEDKSKFPIFVAIQVGASSTAQHRWETCLINYPLSQGDPSQVEQHALQDIQLQENPPITGRLFGFQYTKTEQTQAVLYWYQTATFNTNGTAQTKSVMISLIVYLDGPDEITEAQSQQVPIAKAINSHWQPLKTWSTVTLTLSQNGLVFSSVAAAVLVLLVLYAAYLNIQEKRSLLTLYRKLSTQDQLLIKAIGNTANDSSMEAITAEFQKLSPVPATEPYVSQKLKEAENHGLVKRILKNCRDNPILVWRTQLPKAKGLFPRS
jgi:exosortase